jgi:hypothetical protein
VIYRDEINIIYYTILTIRTNDRPDLSSGRAPQLNRTVIFIKEEKKNLVMDPRRVLDTKAY